MQSDYLWQKVIFPDFVRNYRVLLMSQKDIDAFRKVAMEAFKDMLPASVEAIVSLFQNSPEQIYHPETSPEGPFFCLKIEKLPDEVPIGFAVLAGNQFDYSCEILLYFIDRKHSDFMTGRLLVKLTKFIVNYLKKCGFEYCSTYIYNQRDSLIKLLKINGFCERANIPNFLRAKTASGERGICFNEAITNSKTNKTKPVIILKYAG